jgi:hypothetical protein
MHPCHSTHLVCIFVLCCAVSCAPWGRCRLHCSTEDLRNRELAERRKRLGLPEPKVAVTIAGPRQGKPPAPDEGDDGNGGWISAYEEILRAVMRDLRVYNTARRLHGGGTYLWLGLFAPLGAMAR